MAGRSTESISTKLRNERKARDVVNSQKDTAAKRRKKDNYASKSAFGKALWETGDMWNSFGDDNLDIAGNQKLTDEQFIFGKTRTPMEKELQRIEDVRVRRRDLNYEIKTANGPIQKKQFEKDLASLERHEERLARKNSEKVSKANKKAVDDKRTAQATYVKNVQKNANAKAEKKYGPVKPKPKSKPVVAKPIPKAASKPKATKPVSKPVASKAPTKPVVSNESNATKSAFVPKKTSVLSPMKDPKTKKAETATIPYTPPSINKKKVQNKARGIESPAEKAVKKANIKVATDIADNKESKINQNKQIAKDASERKRKKAKAASDKNLAAMKANKAIKAGNTWKRPKAKPYGSDQSAKNTEFNNQAIQDEPARNASLQKKIDTDKYYRSPIDNPSAIMGGSAFVGGDTGTIPRVPTSDGGSRPIGPNDNIAILADLNNKYGPEGIKMYENQVGVASKQQLNTTMDEYLKEGSQDEWNNISDRYLAETDDMKEGVFVDNPGSYIKKDALGNTFDDEGEVLARAEESGVAPYNPNQEGNKDSFLPEYDGPDETYTASDGKIYANKAVYDKGLIDNPVTNMFTDAAESIGMDVERPGTNSYAARQSQKEWLKDDFTWDSPKINPKTGKDTVEIAKNLYGSSVKTSAKAPVNTPASVAPVIAAVPATQGNYATVDPLNLFGNSNGVNPFALNGKGYSNNRFSGGVVPQNNYISKARQSVDQDKILGLF